jgi:RimJ/RimL family protein N-acetyltransferase
VRTIEEIWPPFGLRLAVGPLLLTPVRDEDIPALVGLAEDGVHDPATMPFSVPWTDAPAEEIGARMAAYYWGERSTFGPDRWSLLFAVRRDGAVVGVQGVHTADYRITRTGETGSWLGRAHQGRGTGTLMRQAVCALMFDHLGAREVTSGAFTDNPASYAVSRKLGYTPNGEVRLQRRPGEVAVNRRLRLRPEDFVRPAEPVTVEGVAAVRRMIGLSADPP